MKTFRFPLYLLLLPLYFVLFLFTGNIADLQVVDLVRPAAASLLLVGVLFGLLVALVRDTGRAALLTFVLWAGFSLYGHLYGLLKTAPAPLSFVGRHSLLLPAALAALAALAFLIVRSRRNLTTLYSSLSIILAALTLFQVVNIALFYFERGGRAASTAPEEWRAGRALPLDEAALQSKPDIYLIVLDTYARADVIRKEIGLDTSPFLTALEEKGFTVAGCSASNYDSTRVSLAATLNLSHIPEIDPRFVPENDNNAILDDYILHSKVRATLESIGYETTAFETGFGFTEMKDAGTYLAPEQPSLLSPDVQPFEALWLKTTALRALFDTRPQFLSDGLNALSFPHSAYVDRQRYLLDTLPQLAARPGPQFVFAHVILPHVPFVFRADGSVTKDDRYFREANDQPVSAEYLVDGYRNQVEYVNSRLLTIVDEILANSPEPPVILIQGDHGLLYYDHFPILNAAYLPGNGGEAWYPTITSVNTFTVVFNRYFNAGLPLLPDVSYTSSYLRPYDLEEAPAAPCSVE